MSRPAGFKHSEATKEKMRGKVPSDATREKLKNSKLSEKNPMWKGKDVGYAALHRWVRNQLVKPKLCPGCKGKPPLDIANISNEYKRDLTDWEWLCRRCHMLKDGRMNALVLRNKEVNNA